ncbi:LOW QUALITY PROTEIN: bcl-2-like protein 10 [Myotis daubentonii]|uniref:LOW QUALITY PROTEIN: bcl-2-like protein 10 n=1 Tax=Myotis daubentonii TaxID=98922 RepID=UPI0028732F0F|nr:LOW QUALITY PROTEIN: bcl-2-like protein 10 [Myotis daubentonii]
MEDELRLCTLRLLTKFLEHCTWRPTPSPSHTQCRCDVDTGFLGWITWYCPGQDGSLDSLSLIRPPPGHTQAPKAWDATVVQDCQSLVTFWCGWLMGKHGTWGMEAQGGWDGLCHSFIPEQPPWGRLLVQS